MKLILFPHSYIHEPLFRKTLKILDSLTVFLPWEMDLPDFMTSENVIETFYPPQDQKPPGEIRSLLSEYSQWMKQNLDKSYLEIIRAKQGTESVKTESASWEIRKLLGSMMSESKHLQDNNSLSRHMILHMAREIEEQSFEAEGLLKSLKRKSPLLDGSVETVDSLHGFLDDLPRLRPEAGFTEEHINKIIDAWFGLFEKNLKQNDLLLTHSRQIVDFLCEKYDEFELGLNTQNQQIIHLNVPLSSYETADNTVTVKGRSLPAFKIKDMILKLTEDREQGFSALERLSDESEESEAGASPSDSMSITLTYFRPLQDKSLSKTDRFIKHLSSRIILLIEE